jgi:3-phenylpropionate/trans-cinnamate dioxygenase ferredoxin component
MPNWIVACGIDDIDREDVIPFEHNGCEYAVYRSPDDQFYATDGMCTHERAMLSDGLVMDHIIECPKHNGRFDYRTGEGKGAPIRVNLKTYATQVEGSIVSIDIG